MISYLVRLVRMFSTHLATKDDKLSCYVIHKHLVTGSKVLAKEFDIDVTPPKLTIGSFPNYTKDLPINTFSFTYL